MGRKPKQVEMDNIDDTPLGQALKRCADIQDDIEGSEQDLAEAKAQVVMELKKINRDQISSHGFKFKIDRTPESEKLKMSRIKL